jgi:ubiquinone/menaquinone biosynthesis C-methylase UbiE
MEAKKNIFDNAQIWNWVDSNDGNKERFEFTEKLTPSNVRSIIDIGCGHGGFLRHISAQRPNLHCVAVDSSDGALQYIQFEKVKASITQVPYPDKTFDCVYALEVLEHLNPTDFKIALDEMVRLSKKYIIVSVPYKENIQENMVLCPSCNSRFHYDGHLQNFDETKMQNLFSERGYVCKEFHRLGWSESYKHYRLYVKLFYPKQLKQLPHFTICPVCYTELKPTKAENGNNGQVNLNKEKASISRYIKNGIKYFWPKERKSYWIIGLYEKK